VKTEILRFCAIAVAAGCAAWQFVGIAHAVAAHRNEGWAGPAFELVYHLLVAAPFLAVAYYCWRRQYRKLFLVLGAAGAIAVFVLLMLLPDWLGISEKIQRLDPADDGWQFTLAGPVSLLCIFIPIFAAAWFYRLCRYLAYRGAPDCTAIRPFKTQATRWLVWLGVLSMLLPVLWMMISLNLSLQSSDASAASGLSGNALYYMSGLNLLGFFLIFVGLIRRRPKGEG
jgi:hypothetical protein